MRLRVVTTRRRGVSRTPREVTRAAGVVGELLVCERLDALLRRTTRVATLTTVGDAKATDLLPPLFDATLLWLSPQGFVLGGTERVTLDDGQQVELGQAWWIRPV